MKAVVDGLEINYHQEGSGRDVLLLHGWGVDAETLRPLYEHLAGHCRVLRLDLPGFGLSSPPQEPWGIYRYADFVAEFIASQGLDQPLILGHSFGGRIALILGARQIPSRLVLTGCAGLKPKRGPGYYLRVYSYKLAKRLMRLPLLNRYYDRAMQLWLKRNPSSDYSQAEGVMRATFVKVVNEDLRYLLPKIKVPTLLLWGDQDSSTPLSDGQVMEREIPDAALVVFPGAGHYAFLDQPGRFYRIVDAFIE